MARVNSESIQGDVRLQMAIFTLPQLEFDLVRFDETFHSRLAVGWLDFEKYSQNTGSLAATSR